MKIPFNTFHLIVYWWIESFFLFVLLKALMNKSDVFFFIGFHSQLSKRPSKNFHHVTNIISFPPFHWIMKGNLLRIFYSRNFLLSTKQIQHSILNSRSKTRTVNCEKSSFISRVRYSVWLGLRWRYLLNQKDLWIASIEKKNQEVTQNKRRRN